MRALLSQLWNLRLHPSPHVRLAWWGGLLCVAALTVVSPIAPVLAVLWAVANLGLAGVACIWGLFHPRAVLRGREAALRWAFWLTLLAALASVSGFEALRLHPEFDFALPPGFTNLNVVLILAIAPIAFLQFLVYGLAGAAVGAFLARLQLRDEGAAGEGVGGWWLATILAATAYVLVPTTNVEVTDIALSVAIAASVPWTSVVLARLLRHPQFTPSHLAGHALGWLVWPCTWRGRRRALDARGIALGLVAGGVALALGGSLLALPRARVLVALIQLRNGVMSVKAYGGDQVRSRVAMRDGIVLLEMDGPAIRDALASRSEVELQADVIRQLAAWGVQRIVLPLPILDAGWTSGMPPRHGVPQPTAENVDRSFRHLPKLLAAMRSAGTVVLAAGRPGLRDVRERQEDLRGTVAEPARSAITALAAAARESGSAGLGACGAVDLPAVPVQAADRRAPGARRELAVPILLAAAATQRAASVAPIPGDATALRIDGDRVPETEPGKVLVDFLDIGPGSRFRRVAYSSVLQGEPVFTGQAPGQPGAGSRWKRAAEFFRDKIVFLDSPFRLERETPLGLMPRMELLAYAASMFASHRYITPAPSWALALWTLLLGAVVGWLSARRDPLDASWRATIPVFVFIAVAVFGFIRGRWLDPVVPLAAAGGAFLLATQATFGQERRARALLQRFLSPQVVAELLADPNAGLGLGGRRQTVCILFADVRGFTGFAEQHTPEEVIEITNRYMEAMTRALHEHEGILDKYTGDGLMALVRVGDAPRQDVARAVRAALAMRDAAAAVSAELAALGRQSLGIGFGVHVGEAVVGLVGSMVQSNYTALGLTVVVGHRLQSIAGAGEVIVSERVYFAVADLLRAEAREPVHVKGISEPVRCYQVMAMEEPARTLVTAGSPAPADLR